jgi:uncharacterized protein (TIGR04255 family)
MTRPVKATGKTSKVKKKLPFQRRIYKNPPIVEAICEIQFVPTDNWNLAYTGLFYEKIKSRYSGKPREQRVLEFATPGVISSQPLSLVQSNAREITKVQFPNENGQEIVTLGPASLGVSRLHPYSGWEKFQKQIIEAFNLYKQIANPQGIRRIGVRYINFIRPPDLSTPPSIYLTTPPAELAALGCNLSTFSQAYEYAYGDGAKLTVNIARVQDNRENLGFLVDLDTFKDWTVDFPKVNQAITVATDLRNRERDAFEALITDAARELFDV